jgi:Cu-processing system ATP-binding protein
LIRVNNLTKRFGPVVAVNDLSFDIEEGECFALLGPNGSGKSTTLKCLVGLAAPTTGQMTVGGFDVCKQAREARRLMSYLPQRVSFADSLTAREVLEFYCRLRRLPSSRIDDVLHGSNFEFNGFTHRPVSEFSGGMTQRLGLAVACLPDASVMVLDEPTISLDPAGAIGFREFLATLKRQGKTIVFSSHMLADVEQLADRVAILVGGKLVALQSVAALRQDLIRHRRLRVEMMKADTRWLEVARQAGAVSVNSEGDALLIAARPESHLPILRALEAAGGQVVRFTTEELSLEDTYLQYVNAETPSHDATQPK